MYFSDGKSAGVARQSALHDETEEEILMQAIAMSLEAGLASIRNMIDQEIVVWFVLFILSYFPDKTEEDMLMRAISLEDELAFETGFKMSKDKIEETTS